MIHKSTFTAIIYIIFLVWAVSGCVHTRPPIDPVMDARAYRLAMSARSLNHTIVSSKGTGTARLSSHGSVETFRFAWAALLPDIIRITFLVSGIHAQTIVSDGTRLSFVSHTGDHRIYTSYSKNPDMEKYIRVPVRLSELISILAGRLPIKKIDDAYFLPEAPDLSTVHVEQAHNSQYQEIRFGRNSRAESIRTFDGTGGILYVVRVIQYRYFKKKYIPVKLRLEDGNGRKLDLAIDNFIANPPIKKTVFQLTRFK